MSDEDLVLFKKQQRIYPRAVTGHYRRLKWLAMGVLLSIYYGAPWLRWPRGDNAPDQAILIDMPARRAYFFGIEIWPDEVYFITGMLVLAAIGLFFVSSLLGRVWCGYACPQTVWTDLFIWVERRVQGDRNERMRRDDGPWTLDRLWRKALTHVSWIAIGLCTGGAWVFYFNDAPTLFENIRHLTVPWPVASWIFGLTLSTYVMAGYAREQVCTYLCPYARFQSAMFDRDTLIIGYDASRGEPRGKHKKGESWDGKGHCIDCTQCVVVCPMGIDIRNGLQMECIACGLCVDACNDVMDKMQLPRGLIRYDTENNGLLRAAAKAQGRVVKDKLRILRPRSYYYIAILSVVSCLMVYALVTRPLAELHVIQKRNPLYVRLTSGDVRNNYMIKILNKTPETRTFRLTVGGIDVKDISFQSALPVQADKLEALGDGVQEYRVSLVAAKQKDVRLPVLFEIKENDGKISAKADTVFVSGEE